MCFPYVKKRYNIAVSKGRIALRDLWLQGGYPLTAAECVALFYCDGTNTFDDIREMLQQAYDISAAQARSDFDELVKKYDECLAVQDHSELRAPQLHSFSRQLHYRNEFWDFNELRDESPTEMTISLTRLCNHKCIYCYQGEEHKKDDCLSKAVWLDFLDQCYELGVMRINLSGGEPRLHPVFWEFLEKANRLGIFVQLLTNGTTFTDDEMDRLSEVGVEYIYLSLPTAICCERYDMLTLPNSKGDLDMALNFLKRVSNGKRYVRVKMVLTKENATKEDIKSVVDVCYDANVDHLHIAPVILTNKEGRQLRPNWQTLEDLTLYINSLRIDNRKTVLGYPANGPYLWKKSEYVRCGGVKTGLNIMADGSITFCEHIAYFGFYIFGNIKNVRLDNIWFSDLPDAVNAPSIDDFMEPCRSCDKNKFCFTGCLFASYIESGEIYGKDPGCPRAAPL